MLVGFCIPSVSPRSCVRLSSKCNVSPQPPCVRVGGSNLPVETVSVVVESELEVPFEPSRPEGGRRR